MENSNLIRDDTIPEILILFLFPISENPVLFMIMFLQKILLPLSPNFIIFTFFLPKLFFVLDQCMSDRTKSVENKK